MWIFLSVIATLAAVYALVLFLVVRVSLRPWRIPIYLAPAALGSPMEEIAYDVEGSRVQGWWLPQSDPKFVAVLAHGYVMNRSEMAVTAHRLWEMGGACLLFDFRAHGQSQGDKCGLGWYERVDWFRAVEEARARHPEARVVGVGASMGAASLAFAAAERTSLVDAMVLDSAYDTMGAALRRWWTVFISPLAGKVLSPTVLMARPVLGFDPNRVHVSDALARAGAVPVLILHGERDRLAIPDDARRNHEAAVGPKELVWFAGVGHSEARLYRPAEYDAALRKFLEETSGIVRTPWGASERL